MEKISYDYSLKNIPIPSKTSCNLKLIEKIESVIKRMRWKAYFFLNEGKCQSDNKNTFGFRSRYHLSQRLELEKFEKDLFNCISSIKFSNYKTDFQQKLVTDIADLKQSKNIFVFADKTSNIYKMSTEQHEKLLGENVTKTYKKASPMLQRSINLEAKHIAKKIK